MPGIGGLEATRRMLRQDDGLRVIAVTVCEDEPFPSRLLHAGAAGYLSKGADLEEMVRAIKVVSTGQRYISPEIAQAMALRPFVPTPDAPLDMLSERELQIMILIVNCHKGQDVADQLCLSPKTVNTYRYRIFDKLGISSDVEMALVAVRHGMVDADGFAARASSPNFGGNGHGFLYEPVNLVGGLPPAAAEPSVPTVARTVRAKWLLHAAHQRAKTASTVPAGLRTARVRARGLEYLPATLAAPQLAHPLAHARRCRMRSADCTGAATGASFCLHRDSNAARSEAEAASEKEHSSSPCEGTRWGSHRVVLRGNG